MELSQEVITLLERLRNEDEVKWLATKTSILEYFRKSIGPDKSDPIRYEENRNAKEIIDASQYEKGRNS